MLKVFKLKFKKVKIENFFINSLQAIKKYYQIFKSIDSLVMIFIL